MLPSELAYRDLLQERPPPPDEVAWFIARQPGVVRFFERALGASDAFAVALEGGFRLCREVERRDGVPPARIPSARVERGFAAAQLEADSVSPLQDSVVRRQPEMMAWAIDFAAFPPVPLTPREARAASACLAALIYAIDEVTTGRPIP